MTIQVRFTVQTYSSRSFGKKVDQEKRDENDVAKGIVKFLVDVFDETGETVASRCIAGATILTMVRKLDQSL
jgi:oxepin-CoA hydrolase/3-oxo-5,6-dehydrosuberyl-CoA semialdehyde dehydrogenase